MIVVDGKTIAQKILNEIKTGLNGRSISIAAVWAGEDQATARFVELKKKYAESVGIIMETYRFNDNASGDELTNKIKELSDNKDIKGIMIELPLPENFNQDNILNSITKEKDIDVLSASAQEDFYNNRSKILPPAVEALKILFQEYGINPKGKNVVIFGQGILVGKPISYWLEQAGAKVFRIDENTENPERFSLQADVVVSGVGKPELIHGDMVKEGAVIVDFGYGKLRDKISGDVEFNSVSLKSGIITPVPGGMGPIVIASFLKNAVRIEQSHLPQQ